MNKKGKMKINIGGCVFVTRQDTLQSLPDTRLACLHPESQEYDSEAGEYYFDRDPDLFRPILNFYRGLGLHLPKNICGVALRNELEFWGISEDLVSKCCWKVFYKVDRDENVNETIHKMSDSAKEVALSPDRFHSPYYRGKHALWTFLSKPKSSILAKLWNNLYMLFILLSVITFVVQSHPFFRLDRELTQKDEDTIRNLTSTKIIMFYRTRAHPALYYLDITCVCVFTLEWILHFYSTPYKKAFLKNRLNVLDIIVIICNWITVVIELNFEETIRHDRYSTLYIVYVRLKYVSVFRIMRFFKLTQRFSSLHIMIISVRKSISELAMMTMSVFIIATMFGCALYIVEFYEEHISDIPIAIWWATVTMTTVGYGDIHPKSSAGRLVGTFCAITGLLVLSMPIAIIASNFNEYHMRDKERHRQVGYRQARLKRNASQNKSKRCFTKKKNDNTQDDKSFEMSKVIHVKPTCF